MTTILSTSGGPHSAQHWAFMSTQQILVVNPQSDGELAIEGRKLETKILELLNKFHAQIQNGERHSLNAKGTARLLEGIDPHVHADLPQWVQEIVDAAKGTPFEQHFQHPDVVKHIYYTLGSHFTTSMEIERDWFCSGHSNKRDKNIVAYAKARNKTFV